MNKTRSFPEVIYSPESQMHTPLRLFYSMIADLRSSRELAWRLFIRDISAQYRQSILGIFWAFLPPIVAGIVFIILRSKNVVNFGETDIPYPVYALVGTTLWLVFTESLNAPLRSVTMAKPMLAKINFPREALFISAFYQTTFNFLIKCIVIIGVLLIFRVQLTLGILFAPFFVFFLIALGFTVGLFLTPFGMLYKDIQSALPIIAQFWFFVTPVVYPPPQTFPYSLLSILNPVSPILLATRDLITKGAVTNVNSFIVVCISTIIGFVFAWVIYRVALPIIIERMSA